MKKYQPKTWESLMSIILLPLWIIYWVGTLIDSITIKCNDYWREIENNNE